MNVAASSIVTVMLPSTPAGPKVVFIATPLRRTDLER